MSIINLSRRMTMCTNIPSKLSFCETTFWETVIPKISLIPSHAIIHTHTHIYIYFYIFIYIYIYTYTFKYCLDPVLRAYRCQSVCLLEKMAKATFPAIFLIELLYTQHHCSKTKYQTTKDNPNFQEFSGVMQITQT